MTYCIDGSSSYPAQLREQAKNDFISQLDHLVVPGFPGAKVNELWILLHSRAPWAKIDAFTIPGIRPAPVREPDPAQPAPPDRNDPAFVFDREAKKQAEEEYQQALSGWQKKAADNERMYQDAQAETLRDLAAAHTAVAQAAQILIAAPPPAGDDGSDFGGCFEKAAVVLGRAAGPRFLIIASDMSAWGEQDLGSLPLAGVRIRVIDFFCLRVSECDAARANWEPVFHAAGAASTDYFDPDEDLSTIFN